MENEMLPDWPGMEREADAMTKPTELLRAEKTLLGSCAGEVFYTAAIDVSGLDVRRVTWIKVNGVQFRRHDPLTPPEPTKDAERDRTIDGE